MSKIKVTVAGGVAGMNYNVDTVSDLTTMLDLENYTATVNGDKQDANYEFSEGDTVVLTENVKGGLL